MRARLWSIILAAGSGRRLAAVTGGVPKQFWTADGSPTLLEDTLRRNAGLSPPERTLVIVDRTHAAFVAAHPGIAGAGQVIYQPRDRGTAAGVLLGLSHVFAHDPDAIVLLTPSDHGVAEPGLFASGIRGAVDAVESGEAEIVLFGVEPGQPESDYGWIVPAAHRYGGLRQVTKFVEKPDAGTARALFEAGSVWNTMVVVARASTLLDRCRRHLSSMTEVFLSGLELRPADRASFLARQYEHLPAADFSRDLLAVVPDMAVHVWPTAMGWSDLGTPERLAAWQRQFRPSPRARPGERTGQLRLAG